MALRTMAAQVGVHRPAIKLRTSWDRFLAAMKRCSHRVRFNNTTRRRFVPVRLCMLSIIRAWLPRRHSAATASVKLANNATAITTTVVLLIPDVTGRRVSSKPGRRARNYTTSAATLRKLDLPQLERFVALLLTQPSTFLATLPKRATEPRCLVPRTPPWATG